MEYLFYKGVVCKKGHTGTYISKIPEQTENTVIVPDWHQLANHGRQKIYREGFISSKSFDEDVLNLTRRHVYGDLNFGEYFFTHIKPQEIDTGKISAEDATDWCGIP